MKGNIKTAAEISQNKRKMMARLVCFMMIIMISALFLYMHLVNVIRSSRNETLKEYDVMTFERIYSELELLRLQSYDSVMQVAQEIETELRKLDLEELKTDMDNGTENEQMTAAIDNVIRGRCLNDINNYKNGIVIMTNDGILEDFNYERANADLTGVRTWDNEINHAWNKELEQDAINKILIHANKRLIAMEKVNTCGKDHMKIPEMTKNNLKEVFLKEGIEGLKNYQFKTAAYITETGDIFGKEDIVHGVKQENHKIIVVQEFNLYDQLNEYSQDLFDKNSDIEVINRRFGTISTITYIMGLFFLASIIILLFYFSHLYNYNIQNALESLENEEDDAEEVTS